MRKFLTILFVILAFAQSVGAQDSLQIAKELEKSKRIYMQRPDSAVYYARNVVRWADDINADWQKAWGLKMIGVYYQVVNLPDSALFFFARSYELFTALNDEEEMGKSQLSLAQLYLQKGDFDKALSYNFEAKGRFRKTSTEDFSQHSLRCHCPGLFTHGRSPEGIALFS